MIRVRMCPVISDLYLSAKLKITNDGSYFQR